MLSRLLGGELVIDVSYRRTFVGRRRPRRTLARMSSGDRSAPILFALEPRGADLVAGMIGTLAQCGGTLVGAIVDGRVRTWVADAGGQLTLVMWPGNFRAHFDPLEVIDDRGEIVARGGRLVLLAGGYLKTQDNRSLGHQRVFSAWQASEADTGDPVQKRRRLPRRPFTDTRLPTAAPEVADLSAAVAEACARAPWVRSAFISRVRRAFRDDGSTETLLAVFVVTDFSPGVRVPSGRQLLASLPPALQDAGINVLGHNVAPTEPLGVPVYERTDHESPE